MTHTVDDLKTKPGRPARHSFGLSRAQMTTAVVSATAAAAGSLVALVCALTAMVNSGAAS